MLPHLHIILYTQQLHQQGGDGHYGKLDRSIKKGDTLQSSGQTDDGHYGKLDRSIKKGSTLPSSGADDGHYGKLDHGTKKGAAHTVTVPPTGDSEYGKLDQVRTLTTHVHLFY